MRGVKDEGEVLESFVLRTEPDGDCSEMTVLFAGQSSQSDSLNLSTLQSEKGIEFKYVVMFGMVMGGFHVWMPRRKHAVCYTLASQAPKAKSISSLRKQSPHPFDAVSILVGSKGAGRRVLPVSLRRNDGSDPMDQRFLAQEIAVIPFVGKKQPRFAGRYCE